MATLTETETETTPVHVVLPAPDPMDPRAAAAATASVKMEELRRNMLDYTEKMTSLGIIPSGPPPKRWFPRLARLWRLFLLAVFPNSIRADEVLDLEELEIILRRRELSGYFGQFAKDRQHVKDCLDHYNRQHPGNEYEPVFGNVSRNNHFHNGACWTHGNFLARKKGSSVFSFLTAPRSVFFYELASMHDFKGVVTCTPVVEPAYRGVFGFPLWCATRTIGELGSFCKTCHCRFGIPPPGAQKISACGHNNVVKVCEMCYRRRSDVLHPNPEEFAFGYHHPYHPYPTKH